MLNKQQQILEFLNTGKDKARPSEYRFWKGKAQITIGNWASLLRDSQADEIVDIWMKKEVAEIPVHLAGEYNTRIPASQPTLDAGAIDDPDNHKTIPIVPAFLTWDILDEIGEPIKIFVSDRVDRFLKAICDRVTAEANIQILSASQEQVKEYVSKQKDDYVSVLWNDFRLIFRFYVPEKPNFESGSIELYWGAVYEIIKVLLLWFRVS